MASTTPYKLGTPIKPPVAPSGSQLAPAGPSTSLQPPPVIPTLYLAPFEQRWLFVSVFGLIETLKIYDILSPYVTNPEPTWSSAVRVAGPWTALGWTLFELGALWSVSLLRIPMLNPSIQQLGTILFLLAAWNLACWFVAEPGAFFLSINVIGPTALGGEWYWSWWYTAKRWQQPPHLEGVHKIRLLPYSTATLNPLSLTYCIPPGSSEPVHIPVIFNNSFPTEISYYIRNLETGHADLVSASGSTLKRPAASQSRLQIKDGPEEEDEVDPVDDTHSALVLAKHRNPQQQLEIAKLPSIKPPESLGLVPKDLGASQTVLFLTFDHPGLITLKTVVDKQGDRFHIAPHHEALVVECPSGGHFYEEDAGKSEKKKKEKVQPAELRCVGDEEVVAFEARGVGSLSVSWKKHSTSSTTTGVIEGIEDDDIQLSDPTGLARRDRVSKTHTVPLRVVHNIPGVFSLGLTSVTDSMFNTYYPSGPAAEKFYNVLGRPSASFDCSSPKELLEGGKTSIDIVFNGEVSLHSPLEAHWSFRSNEGSVKEEKIKVTKKRQSIEVSEAGTYSLLEINGPCSGNVMEPSICEVRRIPRPTVEIQVTTLHECAMDVGVTAAFEFTGNPPFFIEYTEQRSGHRESRQKKRYNGHHGEITLQPDHEGQYTYNFISLSDAKYSNVKLDQPPIRQVVHPLANVDIVGRGDSIKRQQLHSCSGDQVKFEVEAKGPLPLKLNYVKSWNGRSENVSVPLASGRQMIAVDVPSELGSSSGASGKMSIALLNIEDGNGCVRRLPAPSVEVDINRQKPTARFTRQEDVVMTEGDVHRPNLRLTGEGPWEIGYSLDNGPVQKVKSLSANSQLAFNQKGIYRLETIRDAHCEGSIVESDSVVGITFKPRPTVVVQSPASMEQHGTLYRHAGFCAGGEDQVLLFFTGAGPFELGYRYRSQGRTSRHTLKSAKEVGVLHLDTESGSHQYDFIDLKDANYASSPVSLSLEHQVYSRPSVSFVKANSAPICLDQGLRGDAHIKMSGQPPFDLRIGVRKPASNQVKEHSIIVNGHEWSLDLPYTVTEVGRHEISILSVADASSCEQEINEGDVLSTFVEVVESARIVPVNNFADLCVGDSLDFLLQGKAPWTIEYEWLGKKHKVTSSASRFSRYAEAEGRFAVKSVALKDNQCKREVSELVRTVHPLPKVKIAEGLDSLREGDEPAVFVVNFYGTPPFSFTYARSETINNRARVVETQTITDIWEERYTISSSSEGDYEVTSVSDKYCRYPPLTRNEG